MPTAGAISAAGQQKSFSDLQTKFGGSNPITLGEYGDLIGYSSGQIDIDDYAGKSGVIWGSVPSQGGNAMFQTSSSSNVTALAIAQIGFAFQPADKRIRIKIGKGSHTSPVSFNFSSILMTYVNEPATVQVKLTWTAVTTGNGTFTNGSGSFTSGTYLTIAEQSSSSDSGTFSACTWSVSKSSSQFLGSASLDAGGFTSGVALNIKCRALDSSGNVIAEQTSSQDLDQPIFLQATRSGGGFGGGGFEP